MLERPLIFRVMAQIACQTSGAHLGNAGENLGHSLVRDHSGRLPILGWLHFDDPFRWSDGVAREFLFYRLLLSPGRFITIALSDPFIPKGSRKRSRG